LSDHDLNDDAINIDLDASPDVVLPDAPSAEVSPPLDVPVSDDMDTPVIVQEYVTHSHDPQIWSAPDSPPDHTLTDDATGAPIAPIETETAQDEPPFSATDSRIDALTRKIEQYPNAPVNYVLRGEVYSDLGDDALAASDFRRAVALGEQHSETLDWGYVNAAFIDRAIDGLRRLTDDR